jgi:hypothetical protein
MSVAVEFESAAAGAISPELAAPAVNGGEDTMQESDRFRLMGDADNGSSWEWGWLGPEAQTSLALAVGATKQYKLRPVLRRSAPML